MPASRQSRSALYTLILVFFFWGFVAASNGIFIPFCKTHFLLTQLQSQFIDLAFYAGYFIGSILLWLASQVAKVDYLNKMGYRNSIIVGLFMSIVGSLSMIAAVYAGDYYFILSSLFVIALGFSLQQTAAQPFVASLGSESTGPHRLNLAGGGNSLGTLIGPIVVSLVLFGAASKADVSGVSIEKIGLMYVILSLVFLVAVLILKFSKLPRVQSDEPFEAGAGALRFPQLRWGMLAIFTYVGVEVTIQSNLGALLKTEAFGGYEESQIANFISLYWGSLMIGRWTGAISVFNLSKRMRNVLTVVVPFVAFLLIMGANYVSGNDISFFLPYTLAVVVMVLAFFFSKELPARTMIVFGSLGVLAMLLGLYTTGAVATYAFVSGGLFCSIMWPCVFGLSITGLGKYKGQGSSFLIMMIVGGAIIPPIQGAIADYANIHISYWVAVICFAYLGFFGYIVRRVLKRQSH